VRSTRPVLPRSLPPVTTTLSSLRIFIDLAMASSASFGSGVLSWEESPLKHLWGEGDDLHEVPVPQLPGHGAEDAGSARVALRID
jgi:hypothetical protein